MTADGSASLDVLRRRHFVEQVRAVFRRPDGTDLRAQEQALRQRMQRARRRGPGRSLGARGPKPDPGSLAHVYRSELARGADAYAAA